jgi:hypothetical protein
MLFKLDVYDDYDESTRQLSDHQFFHKKNYSDPLLWNFAVSTNKTHCFFIEC